MCGSLVSIVVPVYNVASYLDQCLNSIASQSYSNIEVILVDDGATDCSPDICDHWAEIDGRFQVVHQRNMGLSAARNTGLSRCCGDYVLFVDSDDMVSPRLVEVTLNACESQNAEICFYKFACFADELVEAFPYPESSRFPIEKCSDSDQAFIHLFKQRIHNYAWMHIASIDLYRDSKFLFPVGRKMEDLATTAKLLHCSSRVAYLSDVLYFYRKRDQSIVSTWSHELSLDTIQALKSVQKVIETRAPEIKRAYLNYRLKMLCYCWMNETEQDKSGLTLFLRRERLSNEMKKLIALSSLDEIELINKVKYALIISGLLAPIAKRKNTGRQK